jgi:hypothetical protein
VASPPLPHSTQRKARTNRASSEGREWATREAVTANRNINRTVANMVMMLLRPRLLWGFAVAVSILLLLAQVGKCNGFAGGQSARSLVGLAPRAKAGSLRASPPLRMLFDQIDQGRRAELKGRTYTTYCKSFFRKIDNLNSVAAWTDPLLLADKDQPTNIFFDGLMRGLLFWGSYSAFPIICQALLPLVAPPGDVVLSNEVRASLTGSFLPGIALLFGTLSSHTLTLLVNRQNKLEELVNQELSNLSMLVWHCLQVYSGDDEKRLTMLEAIWLHTDVLIFQSRYQELLQLVQEDPVHVMSDVVMQTTEQELASHMHAGRHNIDRDALNVLKPLIADINRLRTMRISAEGRVLPPVHFVILASLGMVLLFGFTLTSMQTMVGESSVAIVPQESRILFTLLFNAFTLLIEFSLDMSHPFAGRYNVRRTTSTASLIKIRRDIVQAVGPDEGARLHKQARRGRAKMLRNFKQETGAHLPADSFV